MSVFLSSETMTVVSGTCARRPRLTIGDAERRLKGYRERFTAALFDRQ
jgi:hypothetical protein